MLTGRSVNWRTIGECMAARPKASTREKALENREHILEAAEQLFAERGFDGANMRAIASTAGVNKFMLYYHFEDKQTLFEQVLKTVLTPVFRKLKDAIEPAPDLETAVGNVYQIYAELFAAKGGRLRSFMAREIAAGAPRVKLFLKVLAPELAVIWGIKLSEHAGRKLPPEQIAILVMSIMTSVISTFLLEPLFDPLLGQFAIDTGSENFKEHVVQYIMGGVEKRLTSMKTQ